eukprot:COSAG04_NODE_31775_length_255_cov_0.589744_1_plen_75_part_10
MSAHAPPLWLPCAAQSTSGANIDMADRPSTKCTITGTPEQVRVTERTPSHLLQYRGSGVAASCSRRWLVWLPAAG